ncbi:alcohol dehydrogenase [Pichia membranifaciens]|uniref:Alcohol dehydrogenase n=1 Tax=Pichia membranifaciens TaxID=4926 RepID=A0A1Q2YIN1_9ASCO|nr:alcohol dehydrogenase [Pichia membranifaciens]
MAKVNYPEEFAGFAIVDTKDWNKPKYTTYKPKQFGDYDIDIEIECCGLCGSDIMTAKGGDHGWGSITLPQVVGHEIIGKVIKTGPKVTLHKLGDRVGLGAQAFACLDCNRCKHGNEQYCPHTVTTYDGVYPDGYVSQGGYASHVRAHEYMCFPIPEKLDSIHAASLCCAGLTVFSPLKRYIPKNLPEGQVPKVAIVGLGGLGHLAVQFCKALGAEPYVFSRTDNKKEQSFKLGATGFVTTGTEGWEKPFFDQFDLILNCAIGLSGLNIDAFLSILKVEGRFCSVGLPAADEKYNVSPFTFFGNGSCLCSSALGSREEAVELFQMAAENNIVPWVETVPISEENCQTALTRAWDGDVRYRFVFTEFDKAFGTNGGK